jgi:VWFA-related protein
VAESRARRALPLVAALLILLAGETGAEAANPWQPEEPIVTFDDAYTVGMVLVPLVARGRENAATRLRRGDLRLRVSGRAVPIESFEHRHDASISLVVLQDLSGSMAQLERLEASQRAVTCFLDHAIPGDRFALASFASGSVFVEVPFTGELGSLREAMTLWEPYGTTALFDAVSWLPDIAAAARHRRPAALVITDGMDNASEVPAEQARWIVQRADLPVYVLGLRGPRPPPETAESGQADPLKWIASGSGGRYHDITDIDQVLDACASVLTELRNHYLLGFSVSSSGENVYHTIEVELRRQRGGLSLIHRRGYHGGPPAALEGN